MKRALLLAGAFACALTLSCRPKIPATPSPAQSIVILLPDDEGKVGAVTFTNKVGTVALDRGFQAVEIARADAKPGIPYQMDQARAQQLFGHALESLPQVAESFLAYFAEGSDNLTPETAGVLQQVVKAIQDRHSTDVSVIGHADATGDKASNYQLGLRRAQRVAQNLQTLGVITGVLSVESHGDVDLVVQTRRGVAEMQNRRVEIVVR